MATAKLFLVANARVPSERAQSLQVVQMAAAFQRQGLATTLLYAKRRPEHELPPGEDVFGYYSVPSGPRPAIEAVPCLDWIDSVPRKLQYLPARLQELTFSKNAAKRIGADASEAFVLSREIEAARHLGKRGSKRTFLEVHRVPGGEKRRAWLAEAAASCRGIVAISEGVRDDLVAHGIDADRIRVEHDAMEPSRFAAPPSREEARERLGVPQDAQVVVYTGGLLPWKGVGLLIDVARALPEVQFLVAGGMREDVEALRGDPRRPKNLRVDGFQPPAKVVEYLAAADVGVVPNRSKPEISARYTSPLKVFEAMAMGLPLVASDVPSLRAVLTHEKDAILVSPDDATALRHGIARLLKAPKERERLRQASLARAPEHTWDARARRLVDWMREKAGG